MPFDNQIATSIYNTSTSSQGKRCETSFEVSPHTNVPYAKFSCRPPPLPSIVSNETQLAICLWCYMQNCSMSKSCRTKYDDQVLRRNTETIIGGPNCECVRSFIKQ